MNSQRVPILCLTLVLAVSVGISGCGPKAPPVPTGTPQTSTVLTFTSPAGSHDLTMADIKALPYTQGMGGIKDSAGQITLPSNYGGVAMKDLIAHFKVPFDSSMGVTLTAKDGYSMTFSYAQVTNGEFTAYDPSTGNELSTHDPLIAILAYEKEGKLLDPTDEGPLRLTVISAKNNQVVDGHWTEKWIVKMEVKPVGQAWTLHLHGAMSEPIDRGSLQSCSAPSCHGASWQDSFGQTWQGVPLWRLVGRVDDSVSHGTDAFNDALADAGYGVQVVSSDGKTVSLDSREIKRNDNILVAFIVNGADLPEQYYPLRLVGSALQDNQMLGKVEMIQLELPSVTATPAAAASTAPAGQAALVVTGLVSQTLSLTDAEVRALPTATISTVPPKQSAAQNFTGVRLNVLLDVAGIKQGATSAVFTASDGYTATVSLWDIRACTDCLLAFGATPGSYSAIMPGMEGGNWTKDVFRIQIK